MLTPDQTRVYATQGFLVLPGFVDLAGVHAVRDRAWAIVDNSPQHKAAVFSSSERALTSDAALIASGSGVHCFFETGAVGSDGQLNRPARAAVNKIGHALHDLDPVFDRFFRHPSLAEVARSLGLTRPLLWQSQVIFKPPAIGGEVRWHQDASFFDTQPQTVTTFWLALEDATRHNGCLWVQPGGHQGPLRERYVRERVSPGDVAVDRLTMEPLDHTPWPTEAEGVALEVAAGTLVVFHGLLPHGSAANRSAHSRMACTLHVTDGTAAYSSRNWLQRDSRLPVRGF